MKKIVLTVAAMAMAAAAYAALQRPDDVQALATAQVEDSDTVRLAIGKAFIADPKSFDLPAASTRLGKARLEGYAVCTQSAEATKWHASSRIAAAQPQKTSPPGACFRRGHTGGLFLDSFYRRHHCMWSLCCDQRSISAADDCFDQPHWYPVEQQLVFID